MLIYWIRNITIMVLGLGIASGLMGLGSGFAFGTGYGAGVRFGYEDVYPYLKGNMSQIANMLQIPFASSGFKLASGVTDAQGKGAPMGLKTADAQIDSPQSTPTGTVKSGYIESLNLPTKPAEFVNHARRPNDPLRVKVQVNGQWRVYAWNHRIGRWQHMIQP